MYQWNSQKNVAVRMWGLYIILAGKGMVGEGTSGKTNNLGKISRPFPRVEGR